MSGALRGWRRNNLWSLWESRFDPGLLQEQPLILKPGPKGLKVNFLFLVKRRSEKKKSILNNKECDCKITERHRLPQPHRIPLYLHFYGLSAPPNTKNRQMWFVTKCHQGGKPSHTGSHLQMRVWIQSQLISRDLSEWNTENPEFRHYLSTSQADIWDLIDAHGGAGNRSFLSLNCLWRSGRRFSGTIATECVG